METLVTRSLLLLAVTAALGAAAITAAHAQPAPDADYIKKLDRDAMDRAENAPPRNWGPPVPQSSIAQPKMLPLPVPATCKSIAEITVILADPIPGAQTIGITGNTVADTGKIQNGYHQVLYHGRTTGWVFGSLVQPYHNQFNPAVKCTIQGETTNGVVGYSLR